MIYEPFIIASILRGIFSYIYNESISNLPTFNRIFSVGCSSSWGATLLPCYPMIDLPFCLGGISIYFFLTSQIPAVARVKLSRFEALLTPFTTLLSLFLETASYT